MTSSPISLVPSDLIVRTVKYLKNTPDHRLLPALAATTKLPASNNLNLELVRRLVVISSLPDSLLTDRDKIWMLELSKAQKTLLGVWQARVALEAVAAQIIQTAVSPSRPSSPDFARLACQSLHQRYGPGLFWQWSVRLLSPLFTSSPKATLPPDAPTSAPPE